MTVSAAAWGSLPAALTVAIPPATHPSGLLDRVTSEYAWALWLAAPISVTLLAAAWIWWRGRSRGVPTVKSAIAAHHRYLDTLSDVAAKSPPATVPATQSVFPTARTGAGTVAEIAADTAADPTAGIAADTAADPGDDPAADPGVETGVAADAASAPPDGDAPGHAHGDAPSDVPGSATQEAFDVAS